MLDSQKFPQPFQRTTVNANSKAIVFSMPITGGMTGFISDVGNNWYSDTVLVWFVDGEPIEDKIERELAPINKPRKFDPPIVVKKKIEWIATNNTSDDLVFEILCDGFLMKEV